MKRQLSIAALAIAVALASVPVQADVKKEERNQVSFAGMLGRMVNFFGGKSAKEGRRLHGRRFRRSQDDHDRRQHGADRRSAAKKRSTSSTSGGRPTR